MTKFEGSKGDLVWGTYAYPVTKTQKETLDGLRHLMNGLPRARSLSANGEFPDEYYCSQRSDNGDVIIGLHRNSVSVHRNGRITSNQMAKYDER